MRCDPVVPDLVVFRIEMVLPVAYFTFANEFPHGLLAAKALGDDFAEIVNVKMVIKLQNLQLRHVTSKELGDVTDDFDQVLFHVLEPNHFEIGMVFALPSALMDSENASLTSLLEK